MSTSGNLVYPNIAEKPIDDSFHLSSFAANSANSSESVMKGFQVLDGGYNVTEYSNSFEFGSSRWIQLQVETLLYLFYGTLALTAVTSNIIVCYLVLSNQQMRTATNYFIVNLAVGDILMALLCIPFTVLANFIFQYWPFGLPLCIIVSYAQANSVFISAYTMVAISIDKYLAIMYPMRLRMTKAQAKLIILVIWSAALMTSLPTAILSGLIPQHEIHTNFNQSQSFNLTGYPPNNDFKPLTSLQQNNNQPLSLSNETSRSPLLNETKTFELEKAVNRTSSIEISTVPNYAIANETIPNSSIDLAEQPQTLHCQEYWRFWPDGKYYYSMALMILQFILPLLVLVITYTRIVIVVWGKRIPGEEDNVRDARMARSKRKPETFLSYIINMAPFRLGHVDGAERS